MFAVSNKLVTAGDGGFVLTPSSALGVRLAAFMAHGGNFGGGRWRFVHPELGYNMKMSGLAAALAIAAVPEIDRLASHRREVAKWYSKALPNLVQMMPWRSEDENAYDVPWLVGVLNRLESAMTCGASLQRGRLRQEAISCRCTCSHPTNCF